jgi:hypothetical protein
MRRRAAALIALTGAIAGFSRLNTAQTAPVELVARAHAQELSIERLAVLMSTSSLPLQKEVAMTAADLWVSYQLLGYAGARGDTLTGPRSTSWWVSDTTLIDEVMWYQKMEARTNALLDRATRELAMPDTTNLEQKYADHQALAAQHILFMIPEGGAGMSQAHQDSIRRKAEDVRRRVTAANFAELAKEFSEDPGSKDSAGSYAMFGPGTELQMVPEFDEAVRKAKPGEIVPGLIRSQYGFHIIRRHSLDEVRKIFIDFLVQAKVEGIREQHTARILEEAQIELLPAAAATARRVAANPVEAYGDSTVIATFASGRFTAGRLADWVQVIPPEYSVRERLAASPDSVVQRLLRRMIEQEAVAARAEREGVQVDPGAAAAIRREFTAMVLFTLTGLRVDPKSLHAAAATPALRERVAASRVEDGIGRLFATNGKDFIDVPQPLHRALRKKYFARISPASAELAVARAGSLRAALDSTRAKGGTPGR